jgi:hypothetical protein
MGNFDTPLEIPTEVPWQLAATTRPLGPQALGQDTTTISLFTFVPTLESLDTDYPDDRLIYLKFTVSISPMLSPFDKAPPGDPLNLFSGEVLPIWRLLFDIRISPNPYAEGGIKPYFLAASPIRRAMIETGVVGQQASEGDSKSLAIGKSGSQMHEGYSSTIDTTTNSAGLSWALGGVSGSETSTTVAGSRDVVQHVDTTQREASTERKELVSHMTNVSNVLTLLSAFNVGSPYLRFSLWPGPLQPLTIDPADPNLWYAELLRRRSRGIEGIQEFFAIAVVPRDMRGFCIEAQLRRFSVIPSPLPTGADAEKPGDFFRPTVNQEAQIEAYLHRRYPRGTPADDLDVEVALMNNPQTHRPAVSDWWSWPVPDDPTLRQGIVIVSMGDFGTATEAIPDYFGAYKTAIEVWLEMKRDEFEQELLKSPMAEGQLFFKKLTLNTCFGEPLHPLTVISTAASKSKKPVWLNPMSFALPSRRFSQQRNKFDLYREAVFVWNAAENQIGGMILHAKQLLEEDLRFDHPKIVEFALRRLAGLAPEDSANRAIKEIASWFGIKSEKIQELRRFGIVDLRGVAEAILLAPLVERLNRHRNTSQKDKVQTEATRAPISRPQPLPVVLTPDDAEAMRGKFGAMLQKSAEQIWSSKD